MKATYTVLATLLGAAAAGPLDSRQLGLSPAEVTEIGTDACPDYYYGTRGKCDEKIKMCFKATGSSKDKAKVTKCVKAANDICPNSDAECNEQVSSCISDLGARSSKEMAPYSLDKGVLKECVKQAQEKAAGEKPAETSADPTPLEKLKAKHCAGPQTEQALPAEECEAELKKCIDQASSGEKLDESTVDGCMANKSPIIGKWKDLMAKHCPGEPEGCEHNLASCAKIEPGKKLDESTVDGCMANKSPIIGKWKDLMAKHCPGEPEGCEHNLASCVKTKPGEELDESAIPDCMKATQAPGEKAEGQYAAAEGTSSGRPSCGSA